MYNSSGSMGSGLTSKLKVKVILAVVFLIAVGVVLREAFKESDYVYIPIQKGPDLCDLWKSMSMLWLSSFNKHENEIIN